MSTEPVRAPTGLAGADLDAWVDEQIARYASRGIVAPPPHVEPLPVAPAAPDAPGLLSGIGEVASFRRPEAISSPCRAGCGAVVEFPGVCDTCAARARSDEIELYFGAARASIPDEFGWVRRAGAELGARCPVRTEGGAINPRAVAWRAAADLLTGAKLLISISSPEVGSTSRAGKSVLAARILYSVLERGAALAAKSWPVPTPEPAHVSIARRARWVQAVSLADRPERGEVSVFDRALGASILVLNDPGQEDAEGFGGAERRHMTRKLLILRWDKNRPTVLAHAISEGKIAEAYGGGVHGRLFDDARSARIEVSRS